MTGLAVDDAAWRSAWRVRSPADKLALCVGLVLCALVLPPWPGAVLVGAVAVGLALGPARVPAGTFLRAIRWPMAFLAVGALTAVVTLDGGIPGWAPDAAARAGELVGRALAGTSAVLLLATTTPMSDLLPELRRLRVPDAVVEIASVTYRMLFLLLAALGSVREAQTARMGWSTAGRSYRSAGMLAAAVLTRSWDRAHRMHEGLAGRGMETGLRVLPEARPSSPAFLASTAVLLAAVVAVTGAVR
ncbi:cobalt ECF transporter T component CbiQ [Blastococcus atacamensis]|uniref:cobalt ECF transporter T component CbiQ n=1 Tax=Blastococcus atacamensis TaxID=2070508 RepID=UPI000CEC9DB7|nr:cobalt ECF transporter T component CbiQ [Blastococcus atacamensis]